MLNGAKEYVNIFRMHLQENIMSFHLKVQVWKYKLQSFPDPSKVVYVMYCTNNIQIIDMITNILEVIEKGNGQKI